MESSRDYLCHSGSRTVSLCTSFWGLLILLDVLTLGYLESIGKVSLLSFCSYYLQCSELTSTFWRALQEGLDTCVHLSIKFHPQTDGQSKHSIQVIEDILWAFVMGFEGQWDQFLNLVVFGYNKSYRSSIQIAPFEPLFCWPCLSLLSWFESTMRRLCCINYLQKAVVWARVIQNRLRTAQSRRQCHVVDKRKLVRFAIADRVFL